MSVTSNINMDPWLCCQADISISENSPKFEFEDNFTPPLNNKLPDSEEYLAILEEKLQKIKNDPDILAQLAAKREACMQELLNGRNNFNGIDRVDEEILDLEEPIPSSQVLRAIAPHKQALNQDVRMQLDINVQTRRVPRTRRPPPRMNNIRENDYNIAGDEAASDTSWSTVEEYDLQDEE